MQVDSLPRRDCHRWGCIPVSYTLTDENGTSFVYSYHSPGPIVSGITAPAKDGKTAPTATPDNPDRVPSWYDYRSADAAATGTLRVPLGEPMSITRNEMTYSFDDHGRTFSINAAGLVLRRYTYAADAAGQPKLETITSAGGQSVRLSWGAAGRVAAVQDGAGNVWNYQYDANGMLSKVTAPGDNADVREYHYEDADKTLLRELPSAASATARTATKGTGASIPARWPVTRKRTPLTTATS